MTQIKVTFIMDIVMGAMMSIISALFSYHAYSHGHIGYCALFAFMTVWALFILSSDVRKAIAKRKEGK